MPPKYAAVGFGKWVLIDQWRMYGHTNNLLDGELKLQYSFGGVTWVDWVTGIPTRKASWTTMASATEIMCTHVRLVCVVDDTGSGHCNLGELEVYHS